MNFSLACGICEETFNNDNKLPKILPKCGHTICTECLLNIKDNSSVYICDIDKIVSKLL